MNRNSVNNFKHTSFSGQLISRKERKNVSGHPPLLNKWPASHLKAVLKILIFITQPAGESQLDIIEFKKTHVKFMTILNETHLLVERP